jgi:hypothetical protein
MPKRNKETALPVPAKAILKMEEVASNSTIQFYLNDYFSSTSKNRPLLCH